MTLIGKIGRRVIAWFLHLRLIFSVIGSVVLLSMDRRHWSMAVRQVFVNQLYFTSVKALGLLFFVSLLAGVAIVYPVQMWLGEIGQDELLGQVIVALLFNQIGPLLAGFILIGRSGTAICAELAGMRSRGEIYVLETQGVDPAVYLLMPRVLALAVSSFALSVVFVLVSILSGWITGALAGAEGSGFWRFSNFLLMALTPADLAAFFVRSFGGGVLVGVISGVEGISTAGLSTEIPQAVTGGVVGSMTGLIIFSMIVSLLQYV